MRIALIQQHATSDLTGNLARAIAATRRAAEQGAELVAFAELAFTPFYPQRPAEGDVRALAEPIPGPTTETFAALARELGIVVIPNLFERDGGATYDTSPVIDADGTILGRTRMVHITEYTCFHEQQYYAPGNLGAPVYTTRVVASASRSATTVTSRNTCARSASPAPSWSSSRRPASSTNGLRGFSKPSCACPRSRTATSWRCAIASATKTS
jgi:hypothetical protein